MQPQILQDLRARLSQAGLSGLEDRFLPHARLAFDLRLDGPDDGRPGASRWGGAPDVPPDFEWPYRGRFPLGFLAQINLADLLPDAENPFPPRGLLLFFADMTDDRAHIALLESDAPLQRADAPAIETEWGEMPAHRLKIVARADLPQWATRDQEELLEGLSDAQQNAYGDAFNVAERPGDKGDLAGQLLGHVAGIGWDARDGAFESRDLEPGVAFDSENPDHRSGARQWRNLALFDSIASLDFVIGDAGYFHFLIHQDDLARLDFARVYAGLESS